jgi:hypothetical protein
MSHLRHNPNLNATGYGKSDHRSRTNKLFSDKPSMLPLYDHRYYTRVITIK